MKNRPAEEIARFLGFSSREEFLPNFRSWSEKRWTRTLRWLDDAGLAFYFLQRVKDRNAAKFLPERVLHQLESNYALNRQRSADLWERFQIINARFSAAGIPYVILKGFSLITQFCPSAPLRHQGDLDYLIDESSLSTAGEILESFGYTRRQWQSSQESIFLSPGATAPTRSGRQYSPKAPHAIELHLNVWDGELYGLPHLPELFAPQKAQMMELQGASFPALNDEDAFLMQVVHACFHVFNYWIRMSCLLEISYFLEHRAEDWALWDRVEQRVAECSILREFVVIVAHMASNLFHCALPSLIRKWSTHMRPEPRLWMEMYSKDWAFADLPVYEFSLLPDSKLVTFLLQQYRQSGGEQQGGRGTGDRLSRIPRMLSELKQNPALVWNTDWWSNHLLLRRMTYHGLAELRYLCEYPRWQWRLRSRTIAAQSNSPAAGAWNS